jgi:mRNA-degrading endonuclease RelE of RelBE toxin-antitoxin system
VNEGVNPGSLSILWSPEARANLRAIDRRTALDIPHYIGRYLSTRNGDVKKLKPPQSGFRLRCGDHRIFFEQPAEDEIAVTGVKHRREAYR